MLLIIACVALILWLGIKEKKRHANRLEKMYVSGGKRGLDIGLKPADLAKVLNAQFVDVLDT